MRLVAGEVGAGGEQAADGEADNDRTRQRHVIKESGKIVDDEVAVETAVGGSRAVGLSG